MKAKCSYRHCNKTFKLKPSQIGPFERWGNVFCPGTDHKVLEERARLKDKRKKLPDERVCNFIECDITFKPTRSQHFYCCKAHKMKCSVDPELRRNDTIRPPKKKKPKSKYQCRLCGKDPYPNRFFCSSCHRQVGHNDIDEEYAIGVIA